MQKYILQAKYEFLASNVLAILNVICVSYYPYLLSYVIDHFGSLKKDELVFVFGSFILSIFLILVISYLNKISKAVYQKKICTSIRQDVFKSITQMGYAQFHSSKNEKYTSFLINDVEQLYAQFFENLIYLVNSLFMLAAYTVILAFTNWQMCLVIIGSLLLILFVPQLAGRKFGELNHSVSDSKADYLSRSEEILSAHDLIDSDNQERLCGLHDEQLRKMQKNEYALAKYRSFVQVFSGSALYFQLILCFVAGLLFSYFGIISIGVFASSLLYVEYAAQYSANIVDEFLEIRSSKTYRDKCLQFLQPHNLKPPPKREPFENLRLESVSYSIGNKTILHDVSYEFTSGQKYLITGANGTGKSTLLKILAGIAEVSDGRLLFNGIPVCNRTEVGYIPQRRYVFEGSLADNISLFAADLSEEQKDCIASMCSMLNLKYPLSHPISRNGENLSGGEVAKICLIRELYRDKSLLLIDEPMNDIDATSQKDILDFLLQLEKTVIVVAHGLSEPEKFDKVITIRNGTISEYP